MFLTATLEYDSDLQLHNRSSNEFELRHNYGGAGPGAPHDPIGAIQVLTEAFSGEVSRAISAGARARTTEPDSDHAFTPATAADLASQIPLT